MNIKAILEQATEHPDLSPLEVLAMVDGMDAIHTRMMQSPDDAMVYDMLIQAVRAYRAGNCTVVEAIAAGMRAQKERQAAIERDVLAVFRTRGGWHG
jgi:hypothetical protein